jgi:RNA-directed DNA polymerase
LNQEAVPSLSVADGRNLEIPAFGSKIELATALNIRLETLNYWVYGLSSSRRYDTFDLQKRSGVGTRTIHAPIKPLKDIQKALSVLLAPAYSPSLRVHGYVAGRSILTNADRHKRKRWVFRVDLKDFFPSINFGRVRGLFLSPPFNYPDQVATLIAQICCHQNGLPHGAPTSPLVSNLTCRGLDRTLATLARVERCHYTRYCDDLTFSTHRQSFPPTLCTRDPKTGVLVAGEHLDGLITSHGFQINPEKTALRRTLPKAVDNRLGGQ